MLVTVIFVYLIIVAIMKLLEWIKGSKVID